MRKEAKRLIVSGLDRALAAGGLEGSDLLLARADTLAWARARAAAVRGRRGIMGGLGVTVVRPGRAELRPIEVPSAGPGEVTVELLASAISPGTERAQWLRLPNARPALPFAPGYSGAGRVIAAGAGVALAPGDLVAVARARHASVVTVPAAWATTVPAAVPVPEAALVYLAIIAGYGVRRAGPIEGEPVCVIGAGPIGALAQRLVALEGPGPVTVVAAGDRRRAAAIRAGAAAFRTARDGTDGIDAAVVIEATGDPGGVRHAVAAARPGGTVVLLGSPRGVTADAPLADLQRKGLRLVGAHVSALAVEARTAAEDPFQLLAATYLQALAEGRLDASDLAGEPWDPREIGLLLPAPGRGRHGERPPGLGTAAAAAARVARAPRRRAGAPGPGADGAGRGASGVRAASRRLRFSVIGCGDIGLHNAVAIAGAANAELALCHDAAPGLAAAVAERCGGQVAASLDAALDPSRVDAVFLSVPHDAHVPLAVRAAEAGLHVVVEKPLAADLPGAERRRPPPLRLESPCPYASPSATSRRSSRPGRSSAPARSGPCAGPPSSSTPTSRRPTGSAASRGAPRRTGAPAAARPVAAS
jgi:2-desacetyl-2-hydroxyethyl bacteriochlorophyllide A dehydrogenase